MTNQISSDLLAWYKKNARQMPWRGSNDPYAIWISEIMLQQTQVDTVTPYYQRWMEHFPTLGRLASASEAEVLQLWEGLGYYSRARNLLKTARLIVERYGGNLPGNRPDLEKLSGIGPYTAGAILSIAFGLDEPALDGNIRRVLSRLFNISIPAMSKEGRALLWETAREILPKGRAGDFNQALMDLGASYCSPHAPACLMCPINSSCQAYKLGIQEKRPVLEARPVVPHHTVVAALIQDETGRVLITQRPSKGLLGGMWEFPGGKVEAGEELSQGLEREIREELAADILVGEPFGVYRHAYTHFKITLHAFFCRLAEGSKPTLLEAIDMHWAEYQELSHYPMGKIDRKISQKLEQQP